MPNPKNHDEVSAEVEKRGYELQNEYINSKTKLEIWCPTCEEVFYVTWNNFNRGVGCGKCAVKERGVRMRHTIESVTEEFAKHGWKVLPDQEYYGNKTKLNVICNRKHLTTKTYTDFQQRKGCWECKSEDAAIRYRLPDEKAHAVATAAHLTLLSTDYKNVKDLSIFECNKCKFHFETTLDSVKSKKTGCPKCKTSEGERLVMTYLEKLNIVFDHEKKFADCKSIRPLPFDFYFVIDDTPMIIEIDGIQHFNLVPFFGENSLARNLKIDTFKSLYCYNNCISILRIAYTDLDSINTLVDDFIHKTLNSKIGQYYSNINMYNKLISSINMASVNQWKKNTKN